MRQKIAGRCGTGSRATAGRGGGSPARCLCACGSARRGQLPPPPGAPRTGRPTRPAATNPAPARSARPGEPSSSARDRATEPRSPSRSYVLAALRALHLDADLPRLDRRLSGGWLRPGRCLRRTSVALRPGLHQMVIVTPSTRSTAHSRHDFLKREERIGAIGARTRRFASDELANLGRI